MGAAALADQQQQAARPVTIVPPTAGEQEVAAARVQALARGRSARQEAHARAEVAKSLPNLVPQDVRASINPSPLLDLGPPLAPDGLGLGPCGNPPGSSGGGRGGGTAGAMPDSSIAVHGLLLTSPELTVGQHTAGSGGVDMYQAQRGGFSRVSSIPVNRPIVPRTTHAEDVARRRNRRWEAHATHVAKHRAKYAEPTPRAHAGEPGPTHSKDRSCSSPSGQRGAIGSDGGATAAAAARPHYPYAMPAAAARPLPSTSSIPPPRKVGAAEGEVAAGAAHAPATTALHLEGSGAEAVNACDWQHAGWPQPSYPSASSSENRHAASPASSPQGHRQATSGCGGLPPETVTPGEGQLTAASAEAEMNPDSVLDAEVATVVAAGEAEAEAERQRRQLAAGIRSDVLIRTRRPRRATSRTPSWLPTPA